MGYGTGEVYDTERHILLCGVRPPKSSSTRHRSGAQNRDKNGRVVNALPLFDLAKLVSRSLMIQVHIPVRGLIRR